MISALTNRTITRPKRTLLLVVFFVVLAGIVGGPIAGSLQTSGGFSATDSGSARAVEQIEAATGAEAAPGVVVLSTRPEAVARAADVRAELARQPGIAAVSKT